jgi:hypothetical protein
MIAVVVLPTTHTQYNDLYVPILYLIYIILYNNTYVYIMDYIMIGMRASVCVY